MKKTIYVLMIFAFFAGCVRDAEQPVVEEDVLREVVFHACWDPETKTVLQEDGSVWWEPGDAISLFFLGREDVQFNKYKLTSSLVEPAANTDMVGEVSELELTSGSSVIAIYPYNRETYYEPGLDYYTIPLPKVQEACEGSFNRDLFISVAVSDNDYLYFQNICGGIKFSVANEGIDKVVIETISADDYVAGTLTITPSLEATIGLSWSPSHSLEIIAPDGGTFVPGKYYYAVLPALKYSGLKVSYYKGNEVATFKDRSDITIKRSTFKRLSNKDAELTFVKLPDEKALLTSQILPEGVDKSIITEANFYVKSDVITETTIGYTPTGYEPVYFEQRGTVVNYYTRGEVYELSEDAGYGMFQEWTSLMGLDLSSFKTDRVRSMAYMFYKCIGLESLNLSSFNTDECISFDSMFSYCVSLKQLDVSSFVTSACTNMNSMFAVCQSLESLDVSNFNTSNVKDINSIFTHCWNLLSVDISHWDTSNLMETRGMFADCYQLENVNLAQCDFSNMTLFDVMFMNCTSLENVIMPYTETPNLKSIENMFYGCSNLKNISFNGITTSNVTNMKQAFSACSSLDNLDLSSFSTANVTSMFGMFEGCSSLKELDLSSFDTRNVSDMDYMFSNCHKLERLDISSFETSSIEHADAFLQATYGLLSIDLGNKDWSAVNLNEAFYKVADRVGQCHIRCTAETKNKIVSVRGDMGTDPKFIWYGPEDSLPEDIDGRNPDLYYSTDLSNDRKVLVKKIATEGAGIDLVFMGDGFSDRLIADGTYDNAMNNVIDAIFSEEPYKSFEHLFNVYVVYAVSDNEVIGGNTAFVTYDSRTGWAGAIGSYDTPKIWAYAFTASKNGDRREVIPIVILNSTTSDGAVWTTTIHAGVDNYKSDPNWDDYHGGESIAYISGPFNSDISYTAIHEMGHAFGKLADEYQATGAIEDAVRDMWEPLCIYGMYKNIDFTANREEVKWSHLLNDARYLSEGLGCYEGAAKYEYGVWRPTNNSIMRYDANGHYNAPSREAIYYRIHKLAFGKDWQYDYETFVQQDIKNIPFVQQTQASPKHAPSSVRTNKKHLFKMEESISEDGRKMITVIMD